ncbi:MAG: hypothetical protein GXO79_12055 [Chlorobi bacterium]|nr:hypothetical protein [Chlorobiota bacterium]
MKKILILLLLLCEVAVSQNITVLSNKKILSSDLEFYYPHFSPDGKKIAYTNQNFIGLYILNLKNKKTVQITDKQGAGYNPAFSNDGSTIYFRWNEYDGLKKYSSIYSKNLKNNQISVIESKRKNLSPPRIINNKLAYTINNNEIKKQITKADNSVPEKDIWACIEKQQIVIYENGNKKVLAPKGNGNYIWPELSPDKTKILFTFAGHGTFISDLSGNTIADLGYLNASKWLNNNWVVGMKDHDNGKIVTDSDIYMVSADGQKSIQLTHTDNIIEMYPDCLTNNSKIVYHTIDGNIYLMTLKID